MATFLEEWNDIVTDPRWVEKTPEQREKIARDFIYDKKDFYKLRGSSPEIKQVLSDGLGGPKKQSAAKRLGEGVKAGLKAGAAGSIATMAAGGEQDLPGLFDSARELIRTPFVAPDLPYLAGAIGGQLPELAAEMGVGALAGRVGARAIPAVTRIGQQAVQTGAGAIGGTVIPGTATALGVAAAPPERRADVAKAGLTSTAFGAGAGAVGGLMTRQRAQGPSSPTTIDGYAAPRQAALPAPKPPANRLSELNQRLATLDREINTMEAIPPSLRTPESESLLTQRVREALDIEKEIVNIADQPGRQFGAGGRLPGVAEFLESANSPIGGFVEYFERSGTPTSWLPRTDVSVREIPRRPAQETAMVPVGPPTPMTSAREAQEAVRRGLPIPLEAGMAQRGARALYGQAALPPGGEPLPRIPAPEGRPSWYEPPAPAQQAAPTIPVDQPASTGLMSQQPQVQQAQAPMQAPQVAPPPAPVAPKAAKTLEESIALAEKKVQAASNKLQKALQQSGPTSDQSKAAMTALQNASKRLENLKKKEPVTSQPPAAQGPEDATQLLQRLIKEEKGSFDPMAASGAAAKAVINAGNVFRSALGAALSKTTRVGGKGLEKMASGLQKVGDVESFFVDRVFGGGAGALTRVIGRGLLDAGDIISGQPGTAGMPGPIRKAVEDAIAATPGKNYAEKSQAVWDAIRHNPANTGIDAIDNTLNWPRKLFITKYGQSPEMIAAKEAADQAARLQVSKVEDWLERVMGTRTDADMVQLYRDIENPNYQGSDADVLTAKQIISETETRLRDLGAITQEQFNRWNSTYMPRDYAKFWADPEKAPTMAFLWKVTNDAKLKGWYGRGLQRQMDLNEALVEIANGSDLKILSKPNRDGQVYTWRDYTKGERAQWGEVEHAARQMLKYSYQALDSLRKGELLNGLANGSDKKGRWAIPEDEVFTPAPGQNIQRPPEYIDPTTGQKYVFLEGRMDKGINELGNLAGKYVRDDVATMALTNNNMFRGFGEGVINKLAAASKAIADVTMQKLWKRFMTTGNFPGYLYNNMLFGPVNLVARGGSLADVPMAITRMVKNDPMVLELEKMGVIRDGAKLRELSIKLDSVVRKLSNDLPDQGLFTNQNWSRFMDATYAMMADPRRTPEILAAAAKNTAVFGAKEIRKFARRIEGFAAATDDMYRVALVEGLMRRQGMGFEEAAKMANRTFYSAKNVNAVGTNILQGGIPFVKVAAYTLDEIPAQIISNPHRAIYLSAIGTSIPYAAAALMPSKGETIKERIQTYESEQKLLPKRMQNWPISYGIPMSIPAPADESGRPRYIDLGAIALTGQLESVEGLGGVPRMFSPGGPPFIGAQYLFNKDVYTNKPIKKVGPLGETIYDNRAEFLRRQLMPPSITKLSDFAKAQEIFPEGIPFVGADPKRIAKYDAGTQALRTLGPKLEPIDIEKQFRMTMNQYRMQSKEEAQEVNKLRRDLSLAIRAGKQRQADNIRLEINRRNENIRDIRKRMGDMATQLQPALRRAGEVRLEQFEQIEGAAPQGETITIDPETIVRMR